MNRSQRGVSLGSTLLFVLIILTAGLAVSSISVYQLQVSSRQQNQTQALNLARSAVSQAIAQHFEALDPEDITVTSSHNDEAEGLLTFDTTTGRPYSTDNSEQTASVTGWNGQPVPADTVHFVATGEYNGSQRTVEAVVQNQWFPYAMVSAAPIVSTGELMVASVEDPSTLLLPDPPLLPADLASNGENLAIQLEQGLITGDLQTPGTVSITQDVTVRGEIREQHEEAAIPRLEIADFDPDLAGVNHEVLTDPSYDGQTFSGAMRANGPITVTGDLHLDGGLIFVPGDCEVTGSLLGVGILAVEGNLTIGEAAALDGSQKLALLAGGDINIQGNGADDSYIKGVVYTRGNFTAREVAIWGALVVDSAPTAIVTLRDSRLLHDPNAGKVEIAEAQEWIVFGQGLVGTQDRLDHFIRDGLPPTLIMRETIDGLEERHYFPLDNDTLVLEDEQGWRDFYDDKMIEFRQRHDPGWQPTPAWWSTHNATADLIIGNTLNYANDDSWRVDSGPGLELDPQRLMKPDDRVKLLLWRES